MALALGAAAMAQGAQPAAGVVEGRVLGPLGEPMVSVEVWAADWNTPMQRLAQTRTDGEGMFVLGDRKSTRLNSSH